MSHVKIAPPQRGVDSQYVFDGCETIGFSSLKPKSELDKSISEAYVIAIKKETGEIYISDCRNGWNGNFSLVRGYHTSASNISEILKGMHVPPKYAPELAERIVHRHDLYEKGFVKGSPGYRYAPAPA